MSKPTLDLTPRQLFAVQTTQISLWSCRHSLGKQVCSRVQKKKGKIKNFTPSIYTSLTPKHSSSDHLSLKGNGLGLWTCEVMSENFFPVSCQDQDQCLHANVWEVERGRRVYRVKKKRKKNQHKQPNHHLHSVFTECKWWWSGFQVWSLWYMVKVWLHSQEWSKNLSLLQSEL